MKHQEMNLHDTQKTYSGSEVWNHDISSHILLAAHSNNDIGSGFTDEYCHELYCVEKPCQIYFHNSFVNSTPIFFILSLS